MSRRGGRGERGPAKTAKPAAPPQHWCWADPDEGVWDDLCALARQSPVMRGAVIKLLLTMQRQLQGTTRKPGSSSPLGDDCHELKENKSNGQVRLLYFDVAEHLVIVCTFRKDYPRLKPADIARVKRARQAWEPADCSGPIDLDHLKTLGSF